jgi:micrococcal nuclease
VTQRPNYIYRAQVTRVVDGDTVDADIDLGFNEFKRDRIRLIGIDTPESRTRNRDEKRLGLAAKARLKELVAAAPLIKGKKQIFLQTSKDGKGKFGRILGTLWINDEDVCAVLIREGHARPYQGGKKNELGPWIKRVGRLVYRWTPNGYKAMPD